MYFRGFLYIGGPSALHHNPLLSQGASPPGPPDKIASNMTPPKFSNPKIVYTSKVFRYENYPSVTLTRTGFVGDAV